MTYREAVRILADGVPGGVTWAMTGSANLALRGYDVAPGDVDVKTDAAGVRAIAAAFPAAVVRPVSPPGSTDADWIRSYFAVLELAETTVELIGEAEFRDAGRSRWLPAPPVEGNVEWLTIDGVAVPAMSLEYERQQYRTRGDHDRLAIIGLET